MPIEIDRHESALGRWLLARWTPAHMTGAVAGIWYFEGTLTYLRERHFPHGLLELIVHLGPVYGRVEDDRTEPFTRTCISGLQLCPDVVEAPPGRSSVLGVRLRPAGAYQLLGRPINHLTGLTVDLADVTAGAAAELAERCDAAKTPEARVRTAAAWLEARLRAGPAAAPAVRWAARELEKHDGGLSIASLRERTGWSKTRFTAAFREQVGVAPMMLARILRFRSALEMVNRADAPLARIALAAGYYDQSHFNAEFRELSGFAPGEYLTLRRFPEAVSVAEPAPRA